MARPSRTFPFEVKLVEQRFELFRPNDGFADPGCYTISLCTVQSQEGLDEAPSSGPGVLSGFLAGRCVDDVVIYVPE